MGRLDTEEDSIGFIQSQEKSGTEASTQDREYTTGKSIKQSTG